MPLFHAVVWIDHHHAEVVQFDAAQVLVRKVQSHDYETRQHGSAVRTEHEFFGEVCDELADINEVLVTGSKTSLSDFRHYLEKHRPLLSKHIAGWEIVDHPSDGQLVAFARKFFVNHDRMGSTVAPK